jgi:glycosyltransferase involved in cell wall biosynthesis
MVSVGFWFDAPFDYAGGLNYLRNLLFALAQVNDGSVRPVIFFGSNVPAKVEAEFAPLARVVKTRLLQRRTPEWFVERVANRLLGSMHLVTRLLRAEGIDVLSHVWFEYKGVPFRSIAWIPDFQYLFLPELFPGLDTGAETRRLQAIIARSDMVIVSSHAALADFHRIAPPGAEQRATVLQFVSQPRTETGRRIAREEIERRHGFRGRFFFLPNQFWKHKNHLTVLRAVKALKDRGVNVLVVCTGSMRDLRLRDSSYIEELVAFIEENNLTDNVRILGHVDYEVVLTLMRHSIAVLNPSRFEGWSSSVEEAKSMGKPVILSRIDVHVEQAPVGGRYFDPTDVDTLAAILADAWEEPVSAVQGDAERTAMHRLEDRTREYGRAYMNILHAVLTARPQQQLTTTTPD